MKETVAALLILALLASAGCANSVTEDDNGSIPPPPYTDNEHAEPHPETTWVMNEWTDDPCANPQLPALRSRCSPSGRWTIHPRSDKIGTICLVDHETGSHDALFVYADNVPADDYQQIIWLEGWPVWPAQAFWAGDESGVYLWYPNHLQKFWYVTVPDGTVHELTSLLFFNSRDLTRMVTVLGSPTGSRNLVVLEEYVDWEEPDERSYRLVVMDPNGQELTSIIELDTDKGMHVEATPEAIILRCGPSEEITVDGETFRVSQVWLYHKSADGWECHNMGRLSSPVLRQASVTYVTMVSGIPHLADTSPGESERLLFELSQGLTGSTMSRITYRLCIDGNRVFFPSSGVVMEIQE